MMAPFQCSRADAMCSACQQRIITGGWRPEDTRAWRDPVQTMTCEACLSGLYRLADRHGPVLSFGTYLGISDRQRAELTAVHEAAHAVVGEALGAQMTEAVIRNDEMDLSGSPTIRGGTVDWDHSNGIPLATWSTMAMAGVSSEIAWQRRNGLHTQTYLVDAAWQAAFDTASILGSADRTTRPADEVIANGLNLANKIVGEDWDHIAAVADELGRTRRMDRAAVLAAMERARPSRPMATPAPAVPAPRSSPSLPTSSGGSSMSGIDEIRGVLARAVEMTEQAQHALAEAARAVDGARQAVAQVAQSSSRDEVQQVLAQYGVTGDAVHTAGGQLAVSADQIRTYAAQL